MTSYWLYKVPPSSRITAFAEYQFFIQFITFMWCILHLCPLLVFFFPNWRVSAFLISPCITTALLPWSFYLPFSGHSLTLLYVSSDAETRAVPSSQVEDAPVLHMDNTTSSVMVGWWWADVHHFVGFLSSSAHKPRISRNHWWWAQDFLFEW